MHIMLYQDNHLSQPVPALDIPYIRLDQQNRFGAQWYGIPTRDGVVVLDLFAERKCSGNPLLKVCD